MGSIQLSEEEAFYLFRVLEYFKEAEEIEIQKLMSIGGNRDFIPGCEKRLDIFKSLIRKCQNTNNFKNLCKEEEHFFYRALAYYRRSEEREIANLSLHGGNKDLIPDCEKRLNIFESLMRKFGLSKESLLPGKKHSNNVNIP